MVNGAWKHKNLKESFSGSLRGLILVVKTERTARLMMLSGILLVTLAATLGLAVTKLLVLIIVVSNVFIWEVFNTLVENICDILKPQNDPHIKILKDIASGAVLLACLIAAAACLLLVLPKITPLLKQFFR